MENQNYYREELASYKNTSTLKSESNLRKFWKDNDILGKSVAKGDSKKNFTFYDGPITANGVPHHGHTLTMTLKDSVPRFWAMMGYKVERSLGWDCQGLPVEFEIEKLLNFQSKSDIRNFGVEKFNKLCEKTVLDSQQKLRNITERMGRWVDQEKEYSTMGKKYIESVWWSIKELHNKGLLYKGFRVVPFSTRAGTPLSNFEVSQGGYKEYIEDSVYVKCKLKNSEDYLLVWTTTPWTLPGNLLVAVNKEIQYVRVEFESCIYVVAEKLVKNVFADSKIHLLGKVNINDLLEKEYEQPFLDFESTRKDGAFRVIHADHVNDEDGTGLVHQAPYGEDDFNLLKKLELPIIDYLDDTGHVTKLLKDFEGLFYKSLNKEVIKSVGEQKKLFEVRKFEHKLPLCWRTKVPLIYKPVSSWYVAVEKIKDTLIKENDNINWVPSHLQKGRFGKWLEGARDWSLSRNRFWGTPIPVWECTECSSYEVIGSYKELKTLSGVELDDPHKPYVDDVSYECPKCGGKMQRDPDVLDVWYDSGAMPFARLHYPFENRDAFKEKYPAEYVAEGLDQTRGWFYTLHVLGIALFGKKAFNNVVVNGMIQGSDGTKMSKSKKNYTPVEEVLEKTSSDLIRYYLLNSSLVEGEDVPFSEKMLRQARARVILPLLNSVQYFLNYADMNSFVLNNLEVSKHPLDIWVLSYAYNAASEIEGYMKKYKLRKAMQIIEDVIDNLSRFYIRTNRDRFVENDVNAMNTLYSLLTIISRMIAPFMPYTAERMYQSLMVNMVNPKSLLSVHLEKYPTMDGYKVDKSLLKEVEVLKAVINLGMSLREENKTKLRQPLSLLEVSIENNRFNEVLKTQMNVKEVQNIERADSKDITYLSEGNVFIGFNFKLTQSLKEEGIINDFVRAVQMERKNLKFKPNEKTKLTVYSNDKSMIDLLRSNTAVLEKRVNVDNLDFRDLEIYEKIEDNLHEYEFKLKKV